MKIPTTMLTILVLIVISACSTEKLDSPPKWIQTIPEAEDTLYALGVGDNNKEALVSALSKISADLEVNVVTNQNFNDDTDLFTSSSKTHSDIVLGDILILTETTTTASMEGDELHDQTFELSQTLLYDKPDEYLLYKLLLIEKDEVAGLISQTYHFEVEETNIRFDELVLKLNEAEVFFEFYSHDQANYILAKYKVNLENI